LPLVRNADITTIIGIVIRWFDSVKLFWGILLAEALWYSITRLLSYMGNIWIKGTDFEGLSHLHGGCCDAGGFATGTVRPGCQPEALKSNRVLWYYRDHTMQEHRL